MVSSLLSPREEPTRISHVLTPQRQVSLTSHITGLGQPKIGVLHSMIKEGLVKGVVVDDLECATDFLFDACIRAEMTSTPFRNTPYLYTVPSTNINRRIQSTGHERRNTMIQPCFS